MIESDVPAVRFRTLYQGSFHDNAALGLHVLSELREWDHVWRDLDHWPRPAPAPPPVDRSRETIIVLSVGVRPQLGYEVCITDVAVQGTTLVVTATETGPPGGGWMDAVCSPVHVVAVDIVPGTLEDMLLHLHITPIND